MDRMMENGTDRNGISSVERKHGERTWKFYTKTEEFSRKREEYPMVFSAVSLI